MTRAIGFGFIGTGGVAQLHAEAMRRVDNTRLVGAWSRDPGNVTAFAARHGIQGYDSLEALLADPAVEAVAVLTAAAAHVPLALRCLEAGKHVLLEKPIAGTRDEIERLKTAAAAAGRWCVPSHNYIYDPKLREARRRIDNDNFGRLSSFWMIYNQKHPRDFGSPDLLVRELMIHHAYAALYFAGRPLRVSATASNVYFADPSCPDQVMAVVEHEGGVISNLWGSFGIDDFTSSPWTVVYKILGVEGGFQSSWNDTQFGRAEHPGWDKAAYRDSFAFVQDYFVNECLVKGRAPLSTLDDAATALKMVEAMATSLASARKVEID